MFGTRVLAQKEKDITIQKREGNKKMGEVEISYLSAFQSEERCGSDDEMHRWTTPFFIRNLAQGLFLKVS